MVTHQAPGPPQCIEGGGGQAASTPPLTQAGL